jgi:hypothetical protein
MATLKSEAQKGKAAMKEQSEKKREEYMAKRKEITKQVKIIADKYSDKIEAMHKDLKEEREEHAKGKHGEGHQRSKGKGHGDHDGHDGHKGHKGNKPEHKKGEQGEKPAGDWEDMKNIRFILMDPNKTPNKK